MINMLQSVWNRCKWTQSQPTKHFHYYSQCTGFDTVQCFVTYSLWSKIAITHISKIIQNYHCKGAISIFFPDFWIKMINIRTKPSESFWIKIPYFSRYVIGTVILNKPPIPAIFILYVDFSNGKKNVTNVPIFSFVMFFFSILSLELSLW